MEKVPNATGKALHMRTSFRLALRRPFKGNIVGRDEDTGETRETGETGGIVFVFNTLLALDDRLEERFKQCSEKKESKMDHS